MTYQPIKRLQAKDYRLIAKETVQIIGHTKKYTNKQGEVVNLEELIAHSKENTILYQPDAVHELPPSPCRPCRVELTHESTFAAVIRLVTELGIPETVCLDFASARNPGGGFEKGAQAQEECLARQSAMYSNIITKMEMYTHNRHEKSLLYSDYMIYSQSVPIFRDDHEEFLNKPVLSSIITCPAVNLSQWKEDLDEPRRVMLNRVRKIVEVAIMNGNKAAVFGAYGCGVFKNNPIDVASYFKTVLFEENLKEYFDVVVFAILDGKGDKYDGFKHVFGENAIEK